MLRRRDRGERREDEADSDMYFSQKAEEGVDFFSVEFDGTGVRGLNEKSLRRVR